MSNVDAGMRRTACWATIVYGGRDRVSAHWRLPQRTSMSAPQASLFEVGEIINPEDWIEGHTPP